MFKKKYSYHIVFNYKNEIGGGMGSCTINPNRKIKTTEDVEDLQKYIVSEFGIKSVIILNWIRLKA